MTAWIDLTTENDPSKYRNVSLFSKLTQRDEASITNCFYLPILEVNRTANTYLTMATRRIFIPSGCTKFALRFQGTAAGFSGLVRAVMKSSPFFSPAVSIAVAYPAFSFYDIVFDPIATSLILSTGQSVDLAIQLSNTNVAGTTYFRTDSGTALGGAQMGARFYR